MEMGKGSSGAARSLAQSHVPAGAAPPACRGRPGTVECDARPWPGTSRRGAAARPVDDLRSRLPVAPPDRSRSSRCSRSSGSATSTPASSSIPTKADTPRSARDARERRLGHAAPQRAQVLREAAVPVLDDRRGLSELRAPRMDGAPVAGDCRRSPRYWSSAMPATRSAGRAWGCMPAWRSPAWSATSSTAISCPLDAGLAAFLTVALAGFLVAQRAEATLRRVPALDAGRLGGDGRRDAVEGPDRAGAPRRRARRLHAAAPATSRLWRRLHIGRACCCSWR